MFLERELLRLGVSVTGGIEVDAPALEQIGPDVALVATGASLVTPTVPGDDGAHVIDSTVYLTSEEAAGREPDRVETPPALPGAKRSPSSAETGSAAPSPVSSWRGDSRS